MSGGSMNYLYSRVDEEATGRMGDPELNALMVDLVELLHDCEWWHSADISWETYHKRIKEFKAKWLAGGDARNKRLKEIVNDKVEQLRKELLEMIDVSPERKNNDWTQNYSPGESNPTMRK